MKFLKLSIFCFLLSAFYSSGADLKLSAMPKLTNAGPNDLFLVSAFSAGATNSKAISTTNLSRSILAFGLNGTNGQDTNLFQWKDFTGALMGSINSNGFIAIGTNTARFPLDITASPNQAYGTAFAVAQFANDLDTNLWVRFKAGKTANYRRYLAFMKYDESTWDALLGVNEDNTLIYYDAPYGTHRMAFTSGGISQFNSVGTGGVYINREFSGDPGTGTGGLHVYGGSYPSVFLYHLGTNYFYSAPHVWWSVGQSTPLSRFEIVGTSTNTDANFYDGDVTLGILNKSTNVNTVSSLTFEVLNTSFSLFPAARIALDRTSHTVGNTAGGLNFQTSTNGVTATVMGITGDRTVYIGPSNSIAPLTVSKSYVNPSGGLNSTGTVAVFANNNTAGANAAISILSRTSGNAGINFGTDSAEATHQIRSGFAAGTEYNGAIAFLPSGVEQARIDSNGLGIGTGSNHTAKLEVIGAGNTYLLKVNTNTFVITNGMAGFGTSTPNATLHVNGTLKVVDGSQGSGKVFTSDANGLGGWGTAVAAGDYVTTTNGQRITGSKTHDSTFSGLLMLGDALVTNTVSWVTNDISLTATSAVTLNFSGSDPSFGVRATRTIWFKQNATGGFPFVIGTNAVSVLTNASAQTTVWVTTLDGGTNLLVSLDAPRPIVGTAGQVAVANGGSSDTGSITISLPSAVAIATSLTVGGVAITGGSSALNGIFGDGSDGHVNFDGVTTPVAGATLSGGIYTLAKEVFASSMFITNTVTVRNTGYRMFCSGVVTNQGTLTTLANNGAVGSANGTNGAGGTLLTSLALSTGGAGGAGGVGTATTGNAGVAGGNSNYGNGGTGAKGGLGGSGLAAANLGGNGGVGGTLFSRGFRSAPSVNLLFGATVITGGSGGGGGGSGGGDAVVYGAGGGGGGAGGSVLGFWFNGLTNNGTISANGGNGGNGGSPASGNAGGGAAGSAGGGGFIYGIFASRAGSGTMTVTGGTGGTGGTGQGTGANGAPGTNGVDGIRILYNITTGLFE